VEIVPLSPPVIEDGLVEGNGAFTFKLSP